MNPDPGFMDSSSIGPKSCGAESKADTPWRIAKILSAHGIASRRESERMILAGRVSVNGIPARIGQCALAGYDKIAVDGVLIEPRGELVYIMLNKPRGYITTMSDDRGRTTVVDLVTDVGVRVYPVGRLDINTEGLLLMTNDGQFANAVAHPSYNKTKTYVARVRGDAAGALDALCMPMMIDDRMIRAVSVRLTKLTTDGGIYEITINEGRNRQLRKMCAKCDLEVLSLKRLSIGAVRLGSLEAGKWRHLTDLEKKSLSENH